jgi:hypothetical protein
MGVLTHGRVASDVNNVVDCFRPKLRLRDHFAFKVDDSGCKQGLQGDSCQ